jgi:hypothetical protein
LTGSMYIAEGIVYLIIGFVHTGLTLTCCCCGMSANCLLVAAGVTHQD